MSTSTEPIKIAICDDSHADQNSILTMLKAVLQSSRIPYTAETFSSADALLCALDGSRTYQLFLLDVVMSGMNGIQLARRLRDMQQQAEVIFISNDRYMALKGYEVDAVRYLEKPLRPEPLQEAFRAALDRMERRQTIVLATQSGVRRVWLSDIVYAEAQNRGCKIVLTSGTEFVPVRFESFVQQMDERWFERIHRSYLAAYRHIRYIRRYEVEMDNGEIIPLSKNRYADTYERFIRYLQ